jgi:hypothetical protein
VKVAAHDWAGPQVPAFIFDVESAARGTKMLTAQDFRHELFRMMANAQKSGREFIEISARELHARVGPPRGRNHRMPNCCQAMKAQLATDYGDVIVNEPPSGQGPTLTIRYRLPRQKRADL